MNRIPKQLHASDYLKLNSIISKRKIRSICNTYIYRFNAISQEDFNNLVNRLYEEIKGE